MWKVLFVILILGFGTWFVKQLRPDIQRYLTIRSM